MGWTDERVEMLKQFWTEGLSASQIAEKLGGVSRNAVIGKVHRLKLESRVKSVGSAAPAPSQSQAPAQPPAQAAERPVLQPRYAEIEVNQTVVSPRFSPPPQHTAPQRSMPRTMGATALKMDPDEEHELMEVQGDRSNDRRSGPDRPQADPRATDRGHLQMAGRRPFETGFPLLRQQRP